MSIRAGTRSRLVEYQILVHNGGMRPGMIHLRSIPPHIVLLPWLVSEKYDSTTWNLEEQIT